MNLERSIAGLFRLDSENWLRHANPWSVYTRTAVYPLLALAIWSRVWIGWWALVPTAAALLWMWLNPRLFPAPRSTKGWSSRAVFGERVLMNRNNVPVPKHHVRMSRLLNSLNAVSSAPFIYGLIALEPVYTIGGIFLTMAFKFWYLDRMVWLFEDMRDERSEYADWVYDKNEEAKP